MSEEICNCGRGSQLLEEIMGRSVDILITPEGKKVHGWFFLYIFWEYGEGIKEYQVVQKTTEVIQVKIVIENGFDEVQLDKIKQIILSKSPMWIIQFHIVDTIEITAGGKYKFIINELER